MQLATAENIAREAINTLTDTCLPGKCIVVGSVRRKKPVVHDIELLLAPIIGADLFGIAPTSDDEILMTSMLYAALARYADWRGWPQEQNGARKQSFIMQSGEKFECYIVLPPAQWGRLEVLRTGPKEFSQQCVTSKSKGGFFPSGYRQDDGAVWHGNQVVPMEDEKAFFDFLGLNYVQPEHRKATW